MKHKHHHKKKKNNLAWMMVILIPGIIYTFVLISQSSDTAQEQEIVDELTPHQIESAIFSQCIKEHYFSKTHIQWDQDIIMINITVDDNNRTLRVNSANKLYV
jgi:hypothetical protein